MKHRSVAATIVAALCVLLALTGCLPTAATPPAGFSPARVDTIMAAWANERSELYSGHVLGTFERITFQEFAPRKRWVRLLLSCERRIDGVPATLVSFDNASDYARAVCGIEFPPPQLRDRLRTPAQLDYFWSYYSANLIPCLRGLGWEVDGLPSRATFRSTPNGGMYAWDPFEHIHPLVGTTSGFAKNLRAKCPPAPPGAIAPQSVPVFLPVPSP